jgi:hypothetical protein
MNETLFMYLCTSNLAAVSEASLFPCIFSIDFKEDKRLMHNDDSLI